MPLKDILLQEEHISLCLSGKGTQIQIPKGKSTNLRLLDCLYDKMHYYKED